MNLFDPEASLEKTNGAFGSEFNVRRIPLATVTAQTGFSSLASFEKQTLRR